MAKRIQLRIGWLPLPRLRNAIVMRECTIPSLTNTCSAQTKKCNEINWHKKINGNISLIVMFLFRHSISLESLRVELSWSLCAHRRSVSSSFITAPVAAQKHSAHFFYIRVAARALTHTERERKRSIIFIILKSSTL